MPDPEKHGGGACQREHKRKGQIAGGAVILKRRNAGQSLRAPAVGGDKIVLAKMVCLTVSGQKASFGVKGGAS